MSSKPTPVVVSEVCSLCGLDWRRHGKNQTSEKCIELLLAEVRALNAQGYEIGLTASWCRTLL
ncbi:MAG: hypothetical protein ACRDUT_00020 [Mycobacterium sp.]